MATRTPGGASRGRRKQAKPQRKVELELLNNESRDKTTLPCPSSMSPDNNHNEIIEDTDDLLTRLNGVHKEAAVPEEVHNGLSMHSPPKVLKTGGSAEDIPNNDLISVKAAVGGQTEDDEKIQEYLQRSDTAVIYPEPVGHSENVSPLTNGIVGKDGEELNTTSSSEYYIKCPQCQKGCQSFQALKEHMEAAHADLTATSESGGQLSSNASSAVSPTPSLVGTGGPFGCTQCTTSFPTKDQLEKHELLHSPNAQVVSSCKICNKTFANVYRLQRHMISHDESAILRKFKCTECDKAFKFKHHLKEHIRIHSGEKPFECPNCGKRFSHSGSYSSHMTSKKCLVMNLKLGRARAPSNGSMLDSKKSPSMMPMKRSTMTPINNNISTSPNHNSYLPILPKYEAAAAAFLQSSLASNSSIAPFYLTPPSLLNAGHPISPYTMPNLGHIFEQLQQQQSAASPLRPPLMDSSESNPDDYKCHEGSLVSPKIERTDESVPKSNSSSCGELVMDEENEKHANELKDELPEGPNNGDLEAVKRILETVNASVTKQFLQANMQKFSSESSSDCHSISSVHSPRQEFLNCNSCKKNFETQVQVEDHECDQAQERSEGLAAKLEDAITPKCEEVNGSISGNEDQDFERIKNEDEMDCESVTTTDHVSEDGRKVRVRSLISDEQLKVLKDNYKQNPRPKREELEKIAEAINFPVRVVQVWFQNTRARDRREGRLVTVPFTSTPMRYPLVNSTLALSQKMSNSLSISPQYNSAGCSEQPLDLSTKRGQHSAESSPTSSPRRSTSEYHDNPDEVVNLSRKSSRSPTPYVYSNHYQSSNSSEPRQSPSPIDFNNSSRLAQILAQPAHKIPIQGMGLVHVDQLMQLGATDLPSLTQLISNRLSGGAKKIWNGNRDGDSYHEDDLSNANKRKVSQYLGSPVLGGQELEIEGQFSCDQCDKAFSKQSSLARHKYEHSGQRPHKCDECPKAFKHKHHLTEHKRLHSGEKPFQCIKCLKRFSHSGSYSQHMNHRYSYCKPYRE